MQASFLILMYIVSSEYDIIYLYLKVLNLVSTKSTLPLSLLIKSKSASKDNLGLQTS